MTTGNYIAQRLDQARQQLAGGNYGRAMDICAGLVKAEPGNAEANAVMAETVLHYGHASEACLLAERACALAPQRADLRALLSSCLLECGETARAQENAQTSLSLDPHHPRARQAMERSVRQSGILAQLMESAPHPLVSAAARDALQQNFASAYRSVPVLINNRDRVTCLSRLVEWFQAAGYTNIAIIDNASTYAPLLDYYARAGRDVIVYRLDENLGPAALWRSGIAATIGGVPFVYSDSDVLPIEECPCDVVLKLHELLRLYPWVSKAGLGIKIDDLPDVYEHRLKVLAWESQFWKQPLPGNCYLAPIDTTCALYPAGSGFRLEAVRAGSPCLIRHLPWYQDSGQRHPEDQYYADHALPGISSWSGRGIDDRYL